MLIEFDYGNEEVGIYVDNAKYRDGFPEAVVSMDVLERFMPGCRKEEQLAHMILEGLVDMQSPSAAIVARQAIDAHLHEMQMQGRLP